MPFSKSYFEDLSKRIKEYRGHFPTSSLTVTLKVYGKEHNLYTLISADADVLTFAYYDDNKSSKLSAKHEVPTAWPALTVPYEVIESVEFIPGKAPGAEKGMGFKLD
jgi:hypothetical protein